MSTSAGDVDRDMLDVGVDAFDKRFALSDARAFARSCQNDDDMVSDRTGISFPLQSYGTFRQTQPGYSRPS